MDQIQNLVKSCSGCTTAAKLSTWPNTDKLFFLGFTGNESWKNGEMINLIGRMIYMVQG